jgi:hypothetical protein
MGRFVPWRARHSALHVVKGWCFAGQSYVVLHVASAVQSSESGNYPLGCWIGFVMPAETGL